MLYNFDGKSKKSLLKNSEATGMQEMIYLRNILDSPKYHAKHFAKGMGKIYSFFDELNSAKIFCCFTLENIMGFSFLDIPNVVK